jgi:rhamnose utilization protein RhaD (predicted bifunctional aldolase and dehydrogenase)
MRTGASPTTGSRPAATPAVVVLENHGVFVSGDTPEEIRSRYAHLQDTLAAAYAAAGVPTALRYGTPTLTEESIELAGILQDLLGDDARAVVSSAPFAVADGPLTPDHIVYSKAFAYQGPLHADALTAFRHEHGYAPRVIATRVGGFGLGATPKVAQLALELAQDGARVRQLTAAFGGVRYLSVAARVFIENWEVEAYRAQQLSS